MSLILPVIGFFFLFFIGKIWGRKLGIQGLFILIAGMTLLFVFQVLGWLIWFSGNSGNGQVILINLATWVKFKALKVDWLFEFTFFSLLMILMILLVFLTVIFFSFQYMQFDPNLLRFLAYLSLFAGFMLSLVTAGNFLVLFLGWEGVGLSSFLLINFWTTRTQTSKSALKALLLNRVGDFFLLLTIGFTFKLAGLLDFQSLFILLGYLSSCSVPELNVFYVDLIGLSLFLAAMSKSAQAGLHVWLPDAMEGPTPVSAMIHAATMVTAGLYLLLRCSAIIVLSPWTLQLIFIAGFITVLITSFLGAWQYDIKKIIAFSTCSQLGYMMTIIGSSYFSLGFFHLLTHAFFKALLFLAAGGVIHAMQGEQDLRRLSGSLSGVSLKKIRFVFLYSAFLIGTLALIGFFFFAGYYSKENILFSLMLTDNSTIGFTAWFVLSVSVLFTSYYSFRLLWLLFFAPYKSSTRFYQINLSFGVDSYTRSSLGLLMFFSIFVGFGLKAVVLGSLLLDPVVVSVGQSFSTLEFLPCSVKIFPSVLIIIGFCLALKQRYMAQSQQHWSKFSYFVQSKYFYDNLLNKFAKVGLRCGTRIYLSLDKGLLEWVGPYGLFISLRSVAQTIDYTFFDRRIETSFLGLVMGIIFLLVLMWPHGDGAFLLHYK